MNFPLKTGLELRTVGHVSAGPGNIQVLLGAKSKPILPVERPRGSAKEQKITVFRKRNSKELFVLEVFGTKRIRFTEFIPDTDPGAVEGHYKRWVPIELDGDELLEALGSSRFSQTPINIARRFCQFL